MGYFSCCDFGPGILLCVVMVHVRRDDIEWTLMVASITMIWYFEI